MSVELVILPRGVVIRTQSSSFSKEELNFFNAEIVLIWSLDSPFTTPLRVKVMLAVC